MKQIRQGDVLVQQIKEVDVSGMQEVPQVDGRTVLAWGEVTNHHHSLPSGRLYRSNPLTQFLFLDGKRGGVELVHQEHAAIGVGPGKYKVIQQRQWSLERIRRVVD